MRRSSISISLAIASVFLSPVVLATKPLPVQVIESTGMPGKVSAYTGIVNELTAMNATYNELQHTYGAIRSEFESGVSSCHDQKCKIIELQKASEKLTPIATGMAVLSTKAAGLLDNALSQLPAQVIAEREALKKYAQEDIIAGFNNMSQLVKESIGEENLQVDISSLPRESQKTLAMVEATLDDNLDELSQIAVRLGGMKKFAADLASTKAVLEGQAVQFWQNSLVIENEVRSMNRAAETFILLGYFDGAVLSLPDLQPLPAMPRLALPEPATTATPTLVTPKARTLDFGAKVVEFQKFAEKINGQ